MPRVKSSKIWRYFNKVPGSGVDGGTMSTCKLCNKAVKSCGNTTNLVNHIKRNHPNISNPCSPDMQAQSPETAESEINVLQRESDDSCESSFSIDDPFLCPSTSSATVQSGLAPCTPKCTAPKTSSTQERVDSLFKKMASVGRGGTMEAKITNGIVYMIVKDNMPLNTTEKDGFKHLMNVLSPLYKVPVRGTITTMIEDKYNIYKALLKDELSSVTDVCISTDIWTETCNTRSYLGVTVHGLIDGKLESFNLAAQCMDVAHTAENIRNELKHVLQDWGIYDKVVLVVSDNAANMVKAICDEFGKEKHIGCFAHMINLVANKITDDPSVLPVLQKVKGIVSFFKSSVKAADLLRRVTALKLIQSVETRWNSMYYMLERFLLLADKIGPITLTQERCPSMITAQDIQIIKEVINLLKPLEAITKDISGDSYPTASRIIPLVNILRTSINNMIFNTETGKHLQQVLKTEVEKRFANVEKVRPLAIATLLDPRFKKLHFKSPIDVANAMEKIRFEMKEMRRKESLLTISSSSSEGEADEGNDASADNLWQIHEQLQKNTNIQVLSGSSAQSQPENSQVLTAYLHQTTISINSDPIVFWKSHEAVYQYLNKVSLKYMSMIGTSVPSERLFSKTGSIATHLRNRLSPKKLNILMFLNALPERFWKL